jgi:hypothetical protein
MVMTHVVPAQNASCAAELAKPPALETAMSMEALSDERLTRYRFPPYAANSARTVLCAATQGVPPEA